MNGNQEGTGLSQDEKINKFTQAYIEGKLGEALYEKNLGKCGLSPDEIKLYLSTAKGDKAKYETSKKTGSVQPSPQSTSAVGDGTTEEQILEGLDGLADDVAAATNNKEDPVGLYRAAAFTDYVEFLKGKVEKNEEIPGELRDIDPQLEETIRQLKSGADHLQIALLNYESVGINSTQPADSAEADNQTQKYMDDLDPDSQNSTDPDDLDDDIPEDLDDNQTPDSQTNYDLLNQPAQEPDHINYKAFVTAVLDSLKKGETDEITGTIAQANLNSVLPKDALKRFGNVLDKYYIVGQAKAGEYNAMAAGLLEADFKKADGSDYTTRELYFLMQGGERVISQIDELFLGVNQELDMTKRNEIIGLMLELNEAKETISKERVLVKQKYEETLPFGDPVPAILSIDDSHKNAALEELQRLEGVLDGVQRLEEKRVAVKTLRQDIFNTAQELANPGENFREAKWGRKFWGKRKTFTETAISLKDYLLAEDYKGLYKEAGNVLQVANQGGKRTYVSNIDYYDKVADIQDKAGALIILEEGSTGEQFLKGEDPVERAKRAIEEHEQAKAQLQTVGQNQTATQGGQQGN